MIKMTLKSLFLQQNRKNRPEAVGSVPRPPFTKCLVTMLVCNTLELHQFV